MKIYRCLEERNYSGRKVLLVYPKVGADAKNVSLYPPLSLLYLASYLRDYSVAIFDQRVDDIAEFHALLDEMPICVGFSIFTGPQIKYAIKLAEVVKQKGIVTVFGGIHPTILPEQTLENKMVDVVVKGEGELSFRHVVEDIIAGIFVKKKIIESPNLSIEQIRMPEYVHVDIENYVNNAAIMGRSLPFVFSRGCPFECTFCCNPVISKRRWRSMNIDSAMEYLDSTVQHYRLDSVIFWDENLSANGKLFNELASKINNRFNWFAQLRANTLLKCDLNFLERMGLRRISSGLESGSPRVLKEIKKRETVDEYIEVNRKLAKTNINVWYNYITGYPFETLDDLKLTVKLALQILDDNPNANNSTFYLLTPYPGSELGDQYYNEHMPRKLEDWANHGRHNYAATWHSEEMMKVYQRIGFSSKFVGRRLISLFPNDDELKKIANRMTEKWRLFDFIGDEKQWHKLETEGWKVLRKRFGKNAY